MTPRERILAAAVGLVVVLWVANLGVIRYRDALDESRSELSDVEQELSLARAARERGLRSQRQLLDWQQRSLPTNPDIANSLYQDWLQKQLDAAGLEVKDLNSTSSLRSQASAYQEFSYNVGAQGSLTELVAFLYNFYRSGHLHRISKATLRPATEGDGLSIALTVDAIALADADRTDELADVESQLDLPPLDETQQVIAERDLFTAYSAAASDGLSGNNRPNEAEQALVTGMTYGEGGWHMAIRMEDSGELRHFNEGDTVRIGSFRGRVLELDGRRAVIENRRGRVQVELGQKLSEAQELADESG